jgi:hypothetical protein
MQYPSSFGITGALRGKPAEKMSEFIKKVPPRIPFFEL